MRGAGRPGPNRLGRGSESGGVQIVYVVQRAVRLHGTTRTATKQDACGGESGDGNESDTKVLDNDLQVEGAPELPVPKIRTDARGAACPSPIMTLSLDHVRDRLVTREPVTADPSGRIQAAVALTLVPGPDGPELLLIKRASHPGDPWSGQMALPGGRREPVDQDLIDTARRETMEETTVDLSRASLFGALDDLSPSIPHLPPMFVRPFVFALPDHPPVSASDEVALHLWIPCKRLASTRVRESITVRDRKLTVDGYRIGPHLVWGMTERILTPFLDLLLKD